MYANIYPSEPLETPQSIRPQRVKGAAAISFKYEDRKTRLDKLYQHGNAKIRLPKKYDDFAEAVLINTAGGLTGGDQVDWDVVLDDYTKVVITTQACEKSYKASNDRAKVSTTIQVGEGAICNWLPQETILYEGSSLSRKLEVHLAKNSKFIALEAVMLGREAMGEIIQKCRFADRWRIYRDKKIVFSDDVKIEGDIKVMQNSQALLANQKAFATLIYCGPEDDEQLNSIADKIKMKMQGKMMGLSVLNGKIIARFLSCNTYELRAELIPVLKELTGNDLPKVWRI